MEKTAVPKLTTNMVIEPTNYKTLVPVSLLTTHDKTDPLRLVVIGETGNGKSTLCNRILCSYVFRESASLVKAGTTQSKTKTGKNFRGETVTVTDTQGYNDCEGRDSEFAGQMIETIKAQGTVHAFLLVFNGSTARWNLATLDVLRLLAKNFPRFWNNLIVVLNFLPQDDASIARRAQANTDENKVKDVRKAL